jgi:hypothetical protein
VGVFLQIIGGLFLLVVIAILVGFWLLKRQLKKIGEAFMDAAGAATTATPTEIDLVEVINDDWSSSPKVLRYAKELGALGFERGSACRVEQIPGLWVYAMADPMESLYAVIYNHPQAGVWFDIVARYLDDTSITYSNSPMGHQLDHRPGHDKHYDQSGTPASFLGLCTAAHKGRGLRPATTGSFKTDFETAYREEMEWRNGRGGPTETEIRRIADGEYDEDTITAAHSLLARQASESLDETLLQRFLEQSTYNAAEWERIRDRIVIIHEKKPLDDVEEEVSDWAETDCEPPLDGESPRVYMERINSRLSPDEQFKKLGELSDPVGADVYVAPN